MSKAIEDPITSDPVAEAGRRIARLAAALEENSQAQFTVSGTARYRLEAEFEHLQDALMAAEETASQSPACSPAGAMVQVMVALADAGCIGSYAEAAHQAEAERLRRRIDRCLHSVLTLLAAGSGTDPAAIGGDFCGALPEHSPHPAIRRALAA